MRLLVDESLAARCVDQLFPCLKRTVSGVSSFRCFSSQDCCNMSHILRHRSPRWKTVIVKPRRETNVAEANGSNGCTLKVISLGHVARSGLVSHRFAEEKHESYDRVKVEYDNYLKRTRQELAAERGRAAIPIFQDSDTRKLSHRGRMRTRVRKHTHAQPLCVPPSMSMSCI